MKEKHLMIRWFFILVGVAITIGGYFVCVSDPFGGFVMFFGGMILIVWAISSH